MYIWSCITYEEFYTHVLFFTIHCFYSFQTLDHLPLTDPENFGTPVVQVNNIVTNPVLHVLNVFSFFFYFVTTCAQSSK